MCEVFHVKLPSSQVPIPTVRFVNKIVNYNKIKNILLTTYGSDNVCKHDIANNTTGKVIGVTFSRGLYCFNSPDPYRVYI